MNNLVSKNAVTMSEEDQEALVLMTLKMLNATCAEALGNISDLKINHDELSGNGKIEAVWF
jgi:hypothetical protein